MTRTDTTVVCVRCDSREAVPGRFGLRCSECVQELLAESDAALQTRSDTDDAADRQRAALDPLSRCRRVVAAGIYRTGARGDGTHVEVVLEKGTHGVPITVAETLSSHGLEITDVSPRTRDPVQLRIVAR